MKRKPFKASTEAIKAVDLLRRHKELLEEMKALNPAGYNDFPYSTPVAYMESIVNSEARKALWTAIDKKP